MTPKQIAKVLDEMKDGKYHYAGKVHEIKTVVLNDDDKKFSIITNLGRFERKYESAEEFLKYWEPVGLPAHLPSSTNANNLPVIMDSKDSALADEMIDILRENIKKVQADPGYIKQAQTINNNVNSIINVVRTKMDFMKQVKRS